MTLTLRHQIDLNHIAAVIIDHRTIVSAEMPRCTFAHNQRGTDALRQGLLHHRVVGVQAARLDLPALERPRDVPRTRHRERNAFDARRVANDAELSTHRRDGGRSFQVNGGNGLNVGEAGHAGTTQIRAGRVGRHVDGEIRRGADDLRMKAMPITETFHFIYVHAFYRIMMKIMMKNDEISIDNSGQTYPITHPIVGLVNPQNVRRRIAIHIAAKRDRARNVRLH